MNKTLTWMLALTLFAGGAAACSDDSETNSGATEAVAGETSGETSSNADVHEYCDQAEALAEGLKKVMADPTSGDMTALSTQAIELVSAAVQLSSANADDTDEIKRCSLVVSKAVTGA